MRAGTLDRRVTIQAFTTTQSASGFLTEAWTDVATVWARRLDVTARERFTAGQTLATRTAKWTIRYRSDVSAVNRLVDADGQVWDIQGVAELGRREGLEITAVVRPDDGA